MNRYCQLFFYTLFFNFTLHAQHNISLDLQKANPVSQKEMPVKEKLSIHQEYLLKAIKAKSQTQQFFGFIYLYNGPLYNQDYPAVAKNVIEAENIAIASGNKSC
jgi:hypothetical protein